MNWLNRVRNRFVSWLDHRDCKECKTILKLLQAERVLLGSEMIARKSDILDTTTVYVHLARLEDLGLVERCWPERVGPGQAYKRYFYRLRDMA